MPTERYDGPDQGFEAARGAVDLMSAAYLRKWLAKWGVIVPVAFLLSLLDPVLSPLGWIALGLSLVSLGFMLWWRGLLKRKMGGRPNGGTIDVTARGHDDDIMDLKRLEKHDERDG